MLSRIADSMFWMNSYLERSECLLRMVMTNYVLSLDKNSYLSNNLDSVLHIYTVVSEENKLQLTQNSKKAIQYLLLDDENNNSLKIILNRARENARGMQDHITKEMWEQVNQLYHLINNNKISKQLLGGDPLAAMENLINQCLLYTGVTDSTMPRGMAWNFMNLGKFLERCQLTLSITSDQFYRILNENESQRDILYWRNLLFTLSGYELHLKTYRSPDTDKNVLDQAIFNRQFPHSVMYCLERIKKYMDDLVEQNQPKEKAELLRRFGKLISHVQYADQSGLSGSKLHNFLETTQKQVNDFHQQLMHTFFSYS